MINKLLGFFICMLFIISVFSGVVVSDPGDNMPPIADAGGPYYGNVGEEITFDGSASYDPDGGIESWDWDFGDGATGSGAVVMHVYDWGGLYTVTLCVTDDESASSCCDTTALIHTTVFVGLLEFDAINSKDFPMLQGVFLVFSVAVILLNLLADCLYFVLDPRVQRA